LIRYALLIDPIVQRTYTTPWKRVMAFLRRKGRSHYLLHNIRNEGRVRQLYLACLGSRPEITQATVRPVRRKYPNLRIVWHKLRAAASPRPRLLPHRRAPLREMRDMPRSLERDFSELDRRAIQPAADSPQGNEILLHLKHLRGTINVTLQRCRRCKHPSEWEGRSWR